LSHDLSKEGKEREQGRSQEHKKFETKTNATPQSTELKENRQKENN
jgi:hypothetical protein